MVDSIEERVSWLMCVVSSITLEASVIDSCVRQL